MNISTRKTLKEEGLNMDATMKFESPFIGRFIGGTKIHPSKISKPGDIPDNTGGIQFTKPPFG